MLSQLPQGDIFDSTRLGPHFKFNHFDLVSDDWGFVALVKSRFEHGAGVAMKLFRKSRPFEDEAIFQA